MIYLDNGATSMHKPPAVAGAMMWAMQHCANPGRGGHPAAMAAAKVVFDCRETAAGLFGCKPEQVVFTSNCTHGLNIAIRSLVKPGGRVLISGFEHNAVTRPLYGLGAKVRVAGRKLFDQADTLAAFETELRRGADAVICTHVSNVFGYILPVAEIGELCHRHCVPFVVDAAQSAGCLPVNFSTLGADFIAMPGHKGLQGPQGTGMLLCAESAEPLLRGGTGSDSESQEMPSYMPDRLEAGTLNVPGIAGLGAALHHIRTVGLGQRERKERAAAACCGARLQELGFRVFSGADQTGSVSFVPQMDCEEAAQLLAQQGIAVRAGLHCAPLAHESAGTLETGTVRISFGADADRSQTDALIKAIQLSKIR